LKKEQNRNFYACNPNRFMVSKAVPPEWAQKGSMKLIEATEFRVARELQGLSVEEAAQICDVNPRTAYRYEKQNAPASAIQKLNVSSDTSVHAASDTWFKFIDLFAGIGGLRRGFESIGGACVFTSEWDAYSRKTYAANFPIEHEFAGDIREYSADPGRIPSHDVLLAGFPCQPFSIAGVSKKNSLGRPHGFLDDTQGTLFYDTAKIIAHHRPAAFLLENVKNLERHDGGKTFATIKHVLEQELGYHIQHRVISSESFVPQKRERVFIVGFRDKTDFDFSSLFVPKAGNGPKLATIFQSHNEVDSKYTLTQHLWDYLQRYKEKHAAAGNGFGFGLVGPEDVARTLSARYYKDGSEILVAQEGTRPRRLTPRECARLMGFDAPDGADFVIPVSDTQAYRQFGNSVVVPVVKAVAAHMEAGLRAALGGSQIEETSRLPARTRSAVVNILRTYG
jgi:DNA (cytosine-5)-methyltransferase 1